jgi:succinate dehydrogenase flavin-adding protein (antitoxin of CptAB toxin-antitoxin module)
MEKIDLPACRGRFELACRRGLRENLVDDKRS